MKKLSSENEKPINRDEDTDRIFKDIKEDEIPDEKEVVSGATNFIPPRRWYAGMGNP